VNSEPNWNSVAAPATASVARYAPFVESLIVNHSRFLWLMTWMMLAGVMPVIVGAVHVVPL